MAYVQNRPHKAVLPSRRSSVLPESIYVYRCAVLMSSEERIRWTVDGNHNRNNNRPSKHTVRKNPRQCKEALRYTGEEETNHFKNTAREATPHLSIYSYFTFITLWRWLLSRASKRRHQRPPALVCRGFLPWQTLIIRKSSVS